MTDIISAIDQATDCQQCGKPLGDSPSDDFCGETCQRWWRMDFWWPGEKAARASFYRAATALHSGP